MFHLTGTHQGTRISSRPSRSEFYQFGSLVPSVKLGILLELEGHLLDHKYVVDVCVVPLPDEYSGEVPLAFVVPHASLAEKIKSGEGEAKQIKAELIKVNFTL